MLIPARWAVHPGARPYASVERYTVSAFMDAKRTRGPKYCPFHVSVDGSLHNSLRSLTGRVSDSQWSHPGECERVSAPLLESILTELISSHWNFRLALLMGALLMGNFRLALLMGIFGWHYL